MITIPFEVELAKKIQTGEHPGKIVTRDGRDVRVVCFDAKRSLPVVFLVMENEYCEYIYSSMSNGGFYISGEECGYDLVLQVPEWTQYKEGDVLIEGNGTCPFIFKNYSNEEYNYYAGTGAQNKLAFSQGGAWCLESANVRYATDEEKQPLIKALKQSFDSRAKEYLKRFFGIEEVEEKPEYKFEPFQQVLVRDSDDEIWTANFFSHYDNDHAYKYVICGNYSFRICIPYNEETKHLVGTTDNWEE